MKILFYLAAMLLNLKTCRHKEDYISKQFINMASKMAARTLTLNLNASNLSTNSTVKIQVKKMFMPSNTSEYVAD